SQLEALSPKREPKKGAPKWKATSDLLADRTRSGAALFGGVAAVGLLAILGMQLRERAFLDGPLSRGHDSARFTELAGTRGLQTGCKSCHAPLQPVSEARCLGCHDGFQPKAGQQKGHDHLSA